MKLGKNTKTGNRKEWGEKRDLGEVSTQSPRPCGSDSRLYSPFCQILLLIFFIILSAGYLFKGMEVQLFQLLLSHPPFPKVWEEPGFRNRQ